MRFSFRIFFKLVLFISSLLKVWLQLGLPQKSYWLTVRSLETDIFRANLIPVSFYYENLLLIIFICITIKIKKINLTRQRFRGVTLRNGSVKLPLVKTHIVKKYDVTERASLRKEFASKEIVCVSPHWDFSFSGRNLKYSFLYS